MGKLNTLRFFAGHLVQSMKKLGHGKPLVFLRSRDDMAATKLNTKIKRNASTEHWPASGVASTVAGEIAEVVNILC